MYLIATIIIGWTLLSWCFGLIEIILEIPRGYFSDGASFYIMFGYLVMNFYKIKSPLLTKGETNPFTNIKKIELILFFKDIYYSIWWPYYILRKNK